MLSWPKRSTELFPRPASLRYLCLNISSQEQVVLRNNGKIAKLRPKLQNFAIYGDGNPWFFELYIPKLGDLTGATITADFAPDEGSTPTALTIQSTPEGLADSRFSLGHTTWVKGNYDLQIQLPGGTPRTYLYGKIVVQVDKA